MAPSDGSTTKDDLLGRVAVLVEPFAAEHGIELVDVEVAGPHNRRVVRLVADADGGLDIDRIAALSRAVGDQLDDLVPGTYTLEVTSPGTDRPLRTARDFARNTGRTVRVVRTAGLEPAELTGTVVTVDDRLHLDVEGTTVSVDLGEVDHGKVVLPW